MNESEDNADEFAVSYTLPMADLFFRDKPALLEGPRQRWLAARSVIDFGGALLQHHKTLRPERRLRDAVLVAILRRALITAEAIWITLARGLFEGATVLSRTLIDIELNLKLIAKDPTDRMAKRFAAFHYYGMQRHGQKMLGDRTTNASLRAHYGSTSETISIAQSYARYLEMPIFDDVREELKAAQYWHGHQNVRAAFAAVGDEALYHTVYDSTTFFVHDTNADFDFADVVDASPRLKALVQRDPAVVQLHLADMVLRLYSILQMHVDERGIPETLESPPRNDQGDALHLDAFAGLTALVVEHFGQLGSDDEPLVGQDDPVIQGGSPD